MVLSTILAYPYNYGYNATPNYADNTTPQAQAATPSSDPVARLRQLKRMLHAGLISATEFATRKQQILDSI